MKKKMSMFICLLIFSCIFISANAESKYARVYNLSGEETNHAGAIISDIKWKNGTEYALAMEDDEKKLIDIAPEILNEAKEYENIIILDFKTDNEDNPYPEIDSMNVSVTHPEASGGWHLLGKEYRVFYFSGASAEDLSDNITNSNKNAVYFTVNKLGKYVIYLNPRAYDMIFYDDIKSLSEDGKKIWNIYHEIPEISKKEVAVFPPIPEKEGYVFTGWQAWFHWGRDYINPQPIHGGTYRQLYATWVPEDEYEPINIEISSDKSIIKGKENGRKIILKTNYGAFDENEYFPTEWRTEYDAETDEEYKEDILSRWKSAWNIVGNDDLLIESVRLIDNKTVELTLLGNSDDIYTDTDIYIEFDSSILNSEPEIRENEIYYPADTKIKMDKDGVRAKMYRSDNAITLSKQRKPISGGSSSRPARYTVTFNTNGGNNIAKQSVERNAYIKEPEAPQKEGYSFIGWYTDKELLNEFDFETKITKDTVLYAKWEKQNLTGKQIILTIGQKEAIVFGEKIENDVAPQIVNDYTMLPVRFVAENLGADVEWREEAPDIVTIAKNESEIVIYIGETYALVNGEKTKIDIPAFIENDRTFVPARFVYENLGADVDWNEENKRIIISLQEL